MLAGDYSVIDTNPFGGGSFGRSAVHGTDLYFVDTDQTYGAELRRLDTTTGVVSLVADINPGIGDSIPRILELIGDKLYFSAFDPQYGDELRWMDLSEPTVDIHVMDIWSGAYSSKPGLSGDSIAVGDKLYFTIENQQQSADMLCWIDTTLENPVPNFTDRLPGGIFAYPVAGERLFASAANKIFFVGSTPGMGYELQWIDTQANPSVVNTIDFTPGADSTFAWSTSEFGGIVTAADKVFVRRNGDDPFTIWLDASLATPVVRQSSILGSVFASGDTVYSFRPNPGVNSGRLAWADATQSSLILNVASVASDFVLNEVSVQYVADSKMYLNVGTRDDSDFYWIDLASPSARLQKIAFTENQGRANDGGNRGPRAGTSGLWTKHNIAFMNHKLYFPANDDYGNELRWIDTLSTSPIVHTLDISVHNELQGNVRSSYPGQYGGFIPIGDKLYFVADDSDNVEGIDPQIQQSYSAIGKSMLRWIDTTSDDPDLNTIALSSSGFGGPWGFTVVGSKMIYKSAGYSSSGATTQWFDINEENPTVHTIAHGKQNRSFSGWADRPNHMFGVNGDQVFFDSDGFLYRTDLSDAVPQAERVQGPGTLFPGIFGGYASR